MLEHNPVLRERVLGVTAVSAILIGGALGFDTMLTSGWQIGAGGDAHATYAGATPQQYFDDVSRNWTIAPPQRVELASAEVSASTSAVTPVMEDLDGASAAGVSLIPTAPAPAPAPRGAANLRRSGPRRPEPGRRSALRCDRERYSAGDLAD